MIVEDQGKYMVGQEEPGMMGKEGPGMMGGEGMNETEPEMTQAKSLDDALQIARGMFTDNSGGDMMSIRQEESDKVFNNNPQPAGYRT